MAWKLGDIASSEALIEDLYISLRKKSVLWSAITKQTPQARMGYVGQHLTSIVTGIPGGKSGARGFDLVLPDGRQSEIKTCYRVDQLGACKKCGAVVSSVETRCSECGSTEVERKNDSKWLIGVRTELDFQNLLDPVHYYLVLFEFEDINDASNDDINAYIWRVDSTNLGFAACLVDYKLNIQTGSKSGAPFNLWPWSLKFYLMKPELIYRAVIDSAGVSTKVFPHHPDGTGGRGKVVVEPLPSLIELGRTRTLTASNLSGFVQSLGLVPKMTKPALLLQAVELQQELGNDVLCDRLAASVYRQRLEGRRSDIPTSILNRCPELVPLSS